MMIGGDPIFRAETALRSETLAPIEAIPDTIDVDTRFSQPKRDSLIALWHRYSDRFAANPRHPQQTNMVEHYIDTGDCPPVRSRPRRYPPNWEREIEK